MMVSAGSMTGSRPAWHDQSLTGSAAMERRRDLLVHFQVPISAVMPGRPAAHDERDQHRPQLAHRDFETTAPM